MTAGPVRIAVHHRADAFATAVIVREFARTHGVVRRDASAAATAATELAQNIVAHGGARGEMSAWLCGDVLFVRAVDRGPGLTGPIAAFGVAADAGARGGAGLGQGAAAVVRLMDAVQARPRQTGGLEVTARKSIEWEPAP